MLKKQIIKILAISMLNTLTIHANSIFTLDEAIHIACKNSFEAQLARFSFMGSYWTYRSFRAQLKPSVNLSGNLLNFNHSKVGVQSSDNGKINYVNNNSMANSLTLSVDQQIVPTGGTLSLQSYLYRLDQFDYKLSNYNSQPLRLSYTQPLHSYNSLKWEKKTAPKEFEKAKKVYLEAIESVAIQTTTLFFNAIISQSTYKQNLTKYKDLQELYEISEKRFTLGTITKSDLLQLKLSLLNAKVGLTSAKTDTDEALFNLFSYLRVKDYEQVDLTPPSLIPDIVINANNALQMALSNSSYQPSQDLTLLQAQQNLAKTKSFNGIQMQLRGEAGLSKTADRFPAAFRNLQDNEIVGVTLTLPLFDWGLQKGKLKVAKSELQLARTQIEQNQVSYIQNLKRQVIMFNFQGEQCKTSKTAQDISLERYNITKKRFEAGTITVTDLNTAIQEQESADYQYLSQLKDYWLDYYNLRKSTLYDWIGKRKLDADFQTIGNM